MPLLSPLADIAGLSAAAVLTIAAAGITTNEATNKKLVVGGAVFGFVGAAAARERAKNLRRKYGDILTLSVEGEIKNRILKEEKQLKQLPKLENTQQETKQSTSNRLDAIGGYLSRMTKLYKNLSLKMGIEVKYEISNDGSLIIHKPTPLTLTTTDTYAELTLGPEASDRLNDSQTSERKVVITAFGMFWKREAVEWSSNPKLLGMKRVGETPVNFNHQYGIYFLYDKREIIYAGRTTSQRLGKRLYEHTKDTDRLSPRWDRFSWFGLVPVSSSGELGTPPSSYDPYKFVAALEAILIEALEPRRNRKGGDYLVGIKYIQKVDPAVIEKKLMKLIEQL